MKQNDEHFIPFPFFSGSGNNKKQKTNPFAVSRDDIFMLKIAALLGFFALFQKIVQESLNKNKQIEVAEGELNPRISDIIVRMAEGDNAIIDMTIDGEQQSVTLTGEECRNMKAGDIPDNNFANSLLERYDKYRAEASSRFDILANQQSESLCNGLGL